MNSVAEFTAQGAEVQGLGLQSHLRGLQDLEQIILLQVCLFHNIVNALVATHYILLLCNNSGRGLSVK